MTTSCLKAVIYWNVTKKFVVYILTAHANHIICDHMLQSRAICTCILALSVFMKSIDVSYLCNLYFQLDVLSHGPKNWNKSFIYLSFIINIEKYVIYFFQFFFARWNIFSHSLYNTILESIFFFCLGCWYVITIRDRRC